MVRSNPIDRLGKAPESKVVTAAAFDRTHTMPRHALMACVARRILHGIRWDRAGTGLLVRGLVSGEPESRARRRDDGREPGPARGPAAEAGPVHRRDDRADRPICRPGIWTENSRASLAPTRQQKPRCVLANDADWVCTNSIVLRRTRWVRAPLGSASSYRYTHELALCNVRATIELQPAGRAY